MSGPTEKNTPLEIATFVVACLGFLAAAAAAIFTGRQVSIAKDSEVRQLRAYVLVNESAIRVDDSNNVHVRIQFKNSGMTPAFNLIGWGCSIVGRFAYSASGFGVEAELPNGGRDLKFAPASVIGPGDIKVKGSFPFCDSMPPLNRPLSGEERDRLRNGTAAIYVYGEETYTDAFGNPRFVHYRFFTNDLFGMANGDTIDDRLGNDAN